MFLLVLHSDGLGAPECNHKSVALHFNRHYWTPITLSTTTLFENLQLRNSCRFTKPYLLTGVIKRVPSDAPLEFGEKFPGVRWYSRGRCVDDTELNFSDECTYLFCSLVQMKEKHGAPQSTESNSLVRFIQVAFNLFWWDVFNDTLSIACTFFNCSKLIFK